MPKKTKIRPNQRVDLVDFNRAANEYTAESVSFNVERSVLDRRSRLLGGFRVEIADQSANPGQITVYNGNAFDRDGRHLNNEDQVNTAKTITLSGASQTFYIEIEFTETETDSDARAYWDPTFDQTAPIPDGQEFSINTTTRINPDWRIVTPVSTTGFEATSTPSSTKIPLMILVTDGSNQIDATAPGSGFTQVFASTVLEEDIAAGVTSFRVLDATLFPDTGSITVDVGSAVSEGPFTITSVDRVNGIITFAGGPTANAHNAGAIIRMSSGVARFVPERTAAFESVSSPTQPDVARRLYQGDEYRGSALVTSKETFGGRDDLQIRALKDEVDFLAAQLRELKFGAMRPDVTSLAPPNSFNATPRYFDPAGGVQGARHHTVSVGDGTNTFGDFNGTDEVPFQAAIDALPSGGGTIFVKAGTYTFANGLTTTKPVEFIGEHIFTSTIVMGAVADPMFELQTGCFSFAVRNMQLSQAGATTDNAISITDDGDSILLDNVTLLGNIDVTGGTGVVELLLNKVTMTGQNGGGGTAAFSTTTSRAFTGSIRNSNIVAGAGNDGVLGVVSDLVVDNCQITCANAGESCFNITADSDRLTLRDTRVSGTQVMTYTNTPVMENLRIDGVELVSHLASSGVSIFEWYQLIDSIISGVKIDSGVLNYSGTTSGNPGEVFRVVNDGDNIKFSDIYVICDPADYTQVINVNTTFGGGNDGSVWVENCYATDFTRAVKQLGDGYLNISNCLFETATLLDSMCVEIGTTGAGSRVNITNNLLRSGFGPDSIAIRLAGTGSAFWQGIISDNEITAGASATTTSESYGIKVEDNVSGLTINDNFINSVFAAAGAIARGIFIDAATPVTGSLNITGNNIVNIGNNNSNESEAIYILSTTNLYNTIIADNNIEDVDTTGNYPAIGLNVTDDVINLHITNNTISDCGGSGTTTGRGLIELIQNSTAGTVEHVNISNNTMDHRSQGANSGIVVLADNGTAVNSMTINGNTFIASTTSEHGILLSFNVASPTYNEIEICNNSLTNFASTLAGLVGCIELTGGDYNQVNISNNIIWEASFDDARIGIYLTSVATSGGINTSGNILRGQSGTRTAGGCGIRLEDCERIVVNNNNCAWTVEASGAFYSIRVIDCVDGIFSGNFVAPDSGGTQEIAGEGTSDQLYAVGNHVGNSTNNGQISLAGANSTVDASNKLS